MFAFGIYCAFVLCIIGVEKSEGVSPLHWLKELAAQNSDFPPNDQLSLSLDDSEDEIPDVPSVASLKNPFEFKQGKDDGKKSKNKGKSKKKSGMSDMGSMGSDVLAAGNEAKKRARDLARKGKEAAEDGMMTAASMAGRAKDAMAKMPGARQAMEAGENMAGKVMMG